VPRDVIGRTIRVETGDPLDPIDWNGTATFSRPGFDGAFALSWQLPPPLSASSKSSPKRPYAKRFLRAFEYLDMRDGLTLADSPVARALQPRCTISLCELAPGFREYELVQVVSCGMRLRGG
jgi:hypothetical protein